ncbi:MAG: hypothetical protein KDA51_10640, partial [Planctomycetales bacterium]|nr:hypothetical protein [Planctomycetales bacterium]
MFLELLDQRTAELEAQYRLHPLPGKSHEYYRQRLPGVLACALRLAYDCRFAAAMSWSGRAIQAARTHRLRSLLALGLAVRYHIRYLRQSSPRAAQRDLE